MFSEEDNLQELQQRNNVLRSLIEKEENFSKWVEHPSSTILHHESNCCEEARLWFLAYARSMEIGSLARYDLKAPTWLSQLFTWGPSEWPISWCQLVKEKFIDCGVFAALAREILKAQGFEAHPAQILLSYNENCTHHWKDLWVAGKKKQDTLKGNEPRGKSFPWIGNKLVYHEVCALELQDGTARIYDSTWGTWLEPKTRVGFGSLLAIRTECPRLLHWDNKQLSCGEWSDL